MANNVTASPHSTTSIASTGLLAAITSADKVASGTFTGSLGLPKAWSLSPFVRGSGPLDEANASAPVVLADLSGMRSAAKVAAGVSFQRFPWSRNRERHRAACRAGFSDATLAPPVVRERINAGLATFPEAERAGKRDSVRLAVIERLVLTQCRRVLLAPRYQADYDAAETLGTVFLATLSAEYGRRTYRYADTIAVAYTKQTRESYAVNGGLGWYFPNRRLMVSANARWERSWDPGASRDYCVPVAGGPATQCRAVPLGAPAEKEPFIGQFEGRWFINSSVGLSPRVSVDLTGERGWGIELPVLLRQPADKGFTSAIAAGWRSEPSTDDAHDQLYVSVSVGVTFGVALRQ